MPTRSEAGRSARGFRAPPDCAGRRQQGRLCGGRGAAVIVMTETPGISPHVARFARWVRDAGFTVYMPSLFGRDGAVPGAEEGAAISSAPA